MNKLMRRIMEKCKDSGMKCYLWNTNYDNLYRLSIKSVYIECDIYYEYKNGKSILSHIVACVYDDYNRKKNPFIWAETYADMIRQLEIEGVL